MKKAFTICHSIMIISIQHDMYCINQLDLYFELSGKMLCRSKWTLHLSFFTRLYVMMLHPT